MKHWNASTKHWQRIATKKIQQTMRSTNNTTQQPTPPHTPTPSSHVLLPGSIFNTASKSNAPTLMTVQMSTLHCSVRTMVAILLVFRNSASTSSKSVSDTKSILYNSSCPKTIWRHPDAIQRTIELSKTDLGTPGRSQLRIHRTQTSFFRLCGPSLRLVERTTSKQNLTKHPFGAPSQPSNH